MLGHKGLSPDRQRTLFEKNRLVEAARAVETLGVVRVYCPA
jgi:hypothetical protein